MPFGQPVLSTVTTQVNGATKLRHNNNVKEFIFSKERQTDEQTDRQEFERE